MVAQMSLMSLPTDKYTEQMQRLLSNRKNKPTYVMLEELLVLIKYKEKVEFQSRFLPSASEIKAIHEALFNVTD